MSRVTLVVPEIQKPSPENIPEFLPYACGQLGTSFAVLVETKVQKEYVSKAEDKVKKTRKSTSVIPRKSSSEQVIDKTATATALKQFDDDDCQIRITATQDNADKLVGLKIFHCEHPPRILLQVIGLCVPYNYYLNTLQLQNCQLTAPLIYEIAKFLPVSHITEISLDNSPITSADRNYYILLERPSKLRVLSLAHCSISNDDCELLFAKLECPLPAAKTLITLNLTSNFITDSGTKCIGNCLKSNRCLQYLNLAGNQITDDGAMHILNSLTRFRLSTDDIVKKKQRLMNFLRLRQATYEKCYKEIGDMLATRNVDEFSKSSRKPTTKVRSHMQSEMMNSNLKEITETKAGLMVDELVGRYTEPFSSEETVYRDNDLYCAGNMIVCCLNLAYNNLGFITVRKLVEVLQYQASAAKKSGTGLLYVQLEGNNLPDCMETHLLLDSLEQAVSSRLTRIMQPAPRKDRVKSKKKDLLS